MTESWPHIPEAAGDFRYLLARGYPRQAAMSLVGNRYHLGHIVRQLLHRGVFAPQEAASRRAKLRRLADLAGRALGLDGHNVLITLECARRGLPLILADDGFIRDAGQVSRAFRLSPETREVLCLLADYLADRQAGPLKVYYDAPMSRSGELARLTRKLWIDRGLTVEVAAAVPVPELELLAFPGPIGTSDTHLIDGKSEIVDLAGEIIRQHHTWQILDLGG